MKKKSFIKEFYSAEKKVRLYPFYFNIAKGVLIYTLLFFLIINLELFLYLSPSIKITFFILFFISAVFYFVDNYIYFKKKKIYKSKKVKSNFRIFEIIQNTFQLFELQGVTYYSNDLINSAIDEKSKKLNLELQDTEYVRHTKKRRRRSLYLLLISLLIFLIPLFSKEYKSALDRTIDITTKYQKPLAYSIEIINDNFEVYRNENFSLEIELKGEKYPSEIFIRSNNKLNKFKKVKNNKFTYEFINIRENIDFTIETDEYISQIHTINIIDKAKILHYKMYLSYPDYLQRENEVEENINNISVPFGTNIRFEILADNADKFILNDLDKNIEIQKNNNVYTHKSIFIDNRDLFFTAYNNTNSFIDSLEIFVKVIDDEYPKINLMAYQDSLYDNVIYLLGQANDDYGLTKLNLIFDIFEDENDDKTETYTVPIPVENNSLMYNLSEIINLLNYVDTLPRRVDIYAEVFDNDRIRSYKKSVSQKHSFIFKTLEEKQKELEKQKDENISSLSEMSKEADELEKELEDLKNFLKTETKKDWKTQKKIEELQKRYEELKEKTDKLNSQMDQNPLEQFKSEEQKSTEKMLKETLEEEMKSILEELENMLKEDKIDKLRDQIDKIKERNDFMKNTMEMSAEDMKQQQFEDKLDEIIDKLKDINEQQKDLNKEANTKDNAHDNLEKQKDIQQQFESLKKEINHLEQLNKTMERPNNLMDTQQEQSEIDESLENSIENLEDNKLNKAGQNQKSTQEKMQDLLNKMEENRDDMADDNLAEDIEVVRELLKNLINISFMQEELMKHVRRIKLIDPKFNTLVKEQQHIENQYYIIGDTLKSLAKRQPQVRNYVLKEYNLITQNLSGLVDRMFDKKIGDVGRRQQFIMTSTNNLALMLAESLKNMRMQQSSSSSSSKDKQNSDNQCDSTGKSKKKKGKPQLPDINKLQEQLSEMIKSTGDKISEGQGSQMSEELARLAAQQEAIRKMLQDYLDGLKDEGAAAGMDGKLDRILKEMNQIERDILNRNINPTTINRLRNIQTRLLESEKAEIEREKEEKRKSREAEDFVPNNRDMLEIIEKYKLNQQELLKQNPIKLKKYYKDKVSDYFLNFEN